jgi:signal transduction histidine kinase
MQPINLQALLMEIEGMISNYIVEKNARIEYAQLPEVIMGSYTKLQQLFMNLIVNAIKFGPVGEGAEPPLVTISCRDKGNSWEFSIQDNGIGIDPEFHEQIFLLFKKLHPSQEYRGTGIGLALCKKIVEQHGGSITVLSAQGRGSNFIFTINKSMID